MDIEVQELKGYYTTDHIEVPWLKRLMNDLAGRSLARTRASLRAIEDFTREN